MKWTISLFLIFFFAQSIFAWGPYIDNADGTVTDSGTGLIWQKCTVGRTGATCTGGAVTLMDWDDALAACNSLSLASQTDWRLPSVRELNSLVDLRGSEPLIDQTAFPSTAFNQYWTSTSHPSHFSDCDGAAVVCKLYAFGVYFIHGQGVADLVTKDALRAARCVRGP
jgi:hypothetical protein